MRNRKNSNPKRRWVSLLFRFVFSCLKHRLFHLYLLSWRHWVCLSIVSIRWLVLHSNSFLFIISLPPSLVFWPFYFLLNTTTILERCVLRAVDSFKKGQKHRERERKRVASGGLGVFSKRGRRSSGSRSRYQGAALMAALSFCRIIRQTDRQRRERNNQTCRSIGGARAYIHCNICPCQRKKDYSRPVLTIIQLATFFFQPDGKLYYFFFFAYFIPTF